MASVLQITCDYCNRDLTETTFGQEFRLVLKDERITTKTGYSSGNVRPPHLKNGDLCFCGVSCLKKYSADKL